MWVDFHLDVMCPWAYQASLWIRDVREQTGIEIRWRFFSLEEINHVDGKKHAWEREWTYGWSMMRIGALLRRTDMDLLDRWYLAAGTALHVDGRQPHKREVAEQLVTEMGLDGPAVVADAIADATTHDDVRAEHVRVVEQGFFGVPTLFFEDGDALFGPVLVDPPRGADAVKLWDHVLGWRQFPHVYEIQRPKRADDMRLIAETFKPYIEARDWNTVQNKAP
jgi:2-hydroxychromene-2-carboxylate isomerase